MSINTAKVISGFLALITALSSAMDQEQPFAILSKSLPEQQLGLSSYLYGCVSGSFDSLSNTIVNTVSDSAAFRKLGWPPSDALAQQELEKSKVIYKRVNDSIQTQISYSAFLDDCTAITRRNTICQRVLVALDNYPDALNLALFCMQHHRQVLNEFDFLRFLAFVNKEQSKSTQSAQAVCKELTKIMVFPNNNELLNNFVKQSTSHKETEEIKKDDLFIEKVLQDKEKKDKVQKKDVKK